MKITIEFDETERSKVLEFLGSEDSVDKMLAQVQNSLDTPIANKPARYAPLPEPTAAAFVQATVDTMHDITNGSDVVPFRADVDANGLPWDERIHSSSQKFTATGVWARRRNVPDAEFNRIEAELQNRIAAVSPEPVAPAIPVPPVAPAIPLPPAAPVEATVTYAQVEAYVVKKLTESDTLTALSILNPVLSSFGFNAITDAASSTVLDELYAALKEAFNDNA